MTPVLVPSKGSCCGCKACANACSQNAITFLPDEYGFEYPHIDADKCIECGRCLKVCDFKKNEEEGVAMRTPLDGYAARHIDKEVYSHSTSGGIFSALAQWVIDRQGVVYGCVYSDDWQLVHTEADKMEDVLPMRGSKYAQSNTGDVYKKTKNRLQEGKWVLFSGTPCQIAGLYAYLGKTDTQNLITIDVVCHGVPSPLVFKKYISDLERKHGKKSTDFQFRDIKFGWAHPAIAVRFSDGSTKIWSILWDIYYEAFNYSLLQRPSCFECKYATGKRVGDFTLGDFWGWQKANITMSTKEGVCCCLLNTEKAKEIFPQLTINTNHVTVDSIIQGNYHLRSKSKKRKEWSTRMDTIVNEGFEGYAVRFKVAHWVTIFQKTVIDRIVRKLKPFVHK